MTEKKSQKQQDLQSLIQYEYELVTRGKQAANLLKICQEHQSTSQFTQLSTNLLKIQMYSYILIEDYLGLLHFLSRQYEALKNLSFFIGMYKLANYGVNYQIEEMFQLAKDIFPKQNKQIVPQLYKNLNKFAINSLARFYINIEIKKVQDLFKISQKQVISAANSCDHKINKQFIIFKQCQRVNNKDIPLMTKMKQITQMTSMISKYQ